MYINNIFLDICSCKDSNLSETQHHGWTSMMSVILLTSGIQLLCIGILRKIYSERYF